MALLFKELDINGVFIIHSQLVEDERGWFKRVFCKHEFLDAGLKTDFVQVNHSYNVTAFTFRGMHFQNSPYSETKLVRCGKGSICDIITDIRKDSPTFLKSLLINISAHKGEVLYLPKGIAHGFLTMEPSTEVIYHHDVEYHPESASTISVFDPLLRITLPADIHVISDKDKNATYLPLDFKGISL